jgi:hypothetical protein
VAAVCPRHRGLSRSDIMNESTLRQLKILVERAVRTVRASLSCKRKIREDLLAHVTTVFEEEIARLGDEKAALERTAQRFGNPTELTWQLQESNKHARPLTKVNFATFFAFTRSACSSESAGVAGSASAPQSETPPRTTARSASRRRGGGRRARDRRREPPDRRARW